MCSPPSNLLGTSQSLPLEKSWKKHSFPESNQAQLCCCSEAVHTPQHHEIKVASFLRLAVHVGFIYFLDFDISGEFILFRFNFTNFPALAAFLYGSVIASRPRLGAIKPSGSVLICFVIADRDGSQAPEARNTLAQCVSTGKKWK